MIKFWDKSNFCSLGSIASIEQWDRIENKNIFSLIFRDNTISETYVKFNEFFESCK